MRQLTLIKYQSVQALVLAQALKGQMKVAQTEAGKVQMLKSLGVAKTDFEFLHNEVLNYILGQAVKD